MQQFMFVIKLLRVLVVAPTNIFHIALIFITMNLKKQKHRKKTKETPLTNVCWFFCRHFQNKIEKSFSICLDLDRDVGKYVKMKCQFVEMFYMYKNNELFSFGVINEKCLCKLKLNCLTFVLACMLNTQANWPTHHTNSIPQNMNSS